MENKQLVEELTKEENRLLKALEDIRAVKKWYLGEGINVTQTGADKEVENDRKTDYELPTKYDVNLNQLQKVYAALYEIGEGFNADISKKIMEYEPERFNEASAKKMVENKTSILIKERHIKYEKVGVRYKYYIPK